MRRVDWTPEERDGIAESIMFLMIEEPDATTASLFERAQNKLPPERRRPGVKAFTQDLTVRDLVKVKFAQVKAGTLKSITQDPKSVQLQNQLEDIIRERDKAREDLETAKLAMNSVQAALEVLQKQPKPEDVLNQTPTEVLIALLMGRATEGLRTQNNQETRSTLARIEKRMTNLEGSLVQLTKQNYVPTAPPPLEDNAYMPEILLLGGDRSDYQRLYPALTPAGMRLTKFDLTKLGIASFPRHDVLIFWTNGMNEGQRIKAKSRVDPKKTVFVEGTLQKVSEVIREAVDEVRKERTPKNGYLLGKQ